MRSDHFAAVDVCGWAGTQRVLRAGYDDDGVAASPDEAMRDPGGGGSGRVNGAPPRPGLSAPPNSVGRVIEPSIRSATCTCGPGRGGRAGTARRRHGDGHRSSHVGGPLSTATARGPGRWARATTESTRDNPATEHGYNRRGDDHVVAMETSRLNQSIVVVGHGFHGTYRVPRPAGGANHPCLCRVSSPGTNEVDVATRRSAAAARRIGCACVRSRGTSAARVVR